MWNKPVFVLPLLSFVNKLVTPLNFSSFLVQPSFLFLLFSSLLWSCDTFIYSHFNSLDLWQIICFDNYFSAACSFSFAVLSDLCCWEREKRQSVCLWERVAHFITFINADRASVPAFTQPSIHFLITNKRWNYTGCQWWQKQSMILIYWFYLNQGPLKKICASAALLMMISKTPSRRWTALPWNQPTHFNFIKP